MCSPLHGAEPSASVSGALKHTSISAARTKSTSHSGSWGGSNAPCSCSTGSKAWNCVGAAMPGSARASSVTSSRRSSAPSNKAGKQGRIADAVPRCQQFRASSLNLVIAAIVFGNSTHIADGDVWASHASGTDCSVARRWEMAVRLRRRFCGGLLFDVLHHMDQHLGRARIGAGGFVDQRLALGNLAARSVRRDEHRPEAPESSSWADRGELA